MSERKKATKAIAISRVSSKEQEEGYSIDAQKYRLGEYCNRAGLEIIQTFEFSESSTTGNREKFQQAIDFEKRELINLTLLNLELKGCKLVYTLRSPFDAFVKCTKKEDWYLWPDLNRHALKQQILSLSCLPFHHRGLKV